MPKISALPGTPGVAISDIFAEVQPAVGGTTYRASFLNLMNLYQQNLVTPANGGVVYTDATQLQLLAPNTIATKKYLTEISSVPSWETIANADVPGDALTKTDDTNVTLTLGGTPTTALLRAASLTLGWTGQLGLTRGGTNANLTANVGGIFYSTATAGAILAGTATAGQLLQSGASAAPTWSTATYPATSGSVGTILRSDGTNFVNTTATYPTTTTINQILYSSAANTIAGITATARGVLVSDNSSVPQMLSTASVTGQILQGSTTGAPTFSTATYPATVSAAGQLMYSTAANAFGTVANVVSSILVTDAIGIVSWGGTIPAGVQDNITRLGTIVSGVWQGTAIGGTKGGTGLTSIAQGSIIYGSAGDTYAALALGTAGKILVAGATTPEWTTAQYPATAGTSGTLLQSNGTNIVNTTATYPGTAGTSGTLLSSNGTNWVNTTATFPVTATGTGSILRADGTNWVATTATYPTTTTVSQLLYSSSTNVVAGLATANSAMLVTNSTGVPAWSGTMTNGQVIVGSTGATPTAATLTGTANQVIVTNGAASITLTTPQSIGTGSAVTFASVTSTGNVSANSNVTLGNNSLTFSSTDNGLIDINTGGTKVRTIVAAGVYYVQNTSNADMFRCEQNGNFTIIGSITKGSGTFKIDHPLDPKNKYLSHSFVESPDMMNIYNGIVTLDCFGEAVILLPEYFCALNHDFKYQLSCMGKFSPVYISEEIEDNSFTIAGGEPNDKISWQVTGIRKDKFALANPVIPETEKEEDKKGTYLHPDAWLN